ncbi:MT-A70 family methyltransferase [Methylorubrum sp. Q1]|uniref:MT-A70 family methyltransferase n=1 Tax=Methylorubrum sp. Q1 TaxID=2562453 RepID=UPI001FDFEF32|nr:MT-A70 family methyltransferase [Methylorubrum sp. Q1]
MRNRAPLLNPRDIERVRRALEAEEAEAATARMKAGRTHVKFHQGSGRSLDVIGRLAGVSGRTVQKIREIYAAHAADPDRYAKVVADMEASSKVDGAHRKMLRLQDEARVARLRPVAGRFLTLAFDPPWEDESVSEGQRPPYATMSVDALRAMPVPAWGLDEGHIYIHAPGPFLAIAIELAGAWGYDFKTVIGWKKPHFSMGRYFRTIEEFVVFGVRGGLMVRRQDLPNHFAGPVGEHSEKPEAFYDLVRAASFPPYGEGFQRQARPDFTNLYIESPSMAVAAE